MKRFLSIVVSLSILAILYWKIDFQDLIGAFRDCNLGWLVISLGMVFPLTMLTSWRLQQLTPTGVHLSFAEANRLILASCVLNMLLPSKMGDLAKAYFMKQRGHLEGSLALSLVVFEKACDLLSLLLWCVFGLLFYPQKDWLFWLMTGSISIGLLGGTLLLSSRRFAELFFDLSRTVLPNKVANKLDTLQVAWGEMHGYFWGDQLQLIIITLTSVFLWFLHLLQIWLFILALNASTPFLANLALAPLTILAGLLPLTFAGVGTRDAALIAFYQPYLSASTAAALGVLCTSRYFLPALGGIPFLQRYLVAVKKVDLTET